MSDTEPGPTRTNHIRRHWVAAYETRRTSDPLSVFSWKPIEHREFVGWEAVIEQLWTDGEWRPIPNIADKGPNGEEMESREG